MSMKKILLPLMLLLIVTLNTYAGDGDQFFTLNTGILFRNTLNASFGFERELNYDNASRYLVKLETAGKEILNVVRYVANLFGKTTTGMVVLSIRKVSFAGVIQHCVSMSDP